WIDFEFDHKDILHVRIGCRRKLPATVLIRALAWLQDTAKKNPIYFGGCTEEIINYYYKTHTIYLNSPESFEKSVALALLHGQRATRDVKSKSGELIVKKNRKFTRGAIRKLEAAGMTKLPIDADELYSKVSAYDVVNESTGEVIL